MTREQKKNKLGNAVREYRGSYDEKSGEWHRLPKKGAEKRIIRWLEALGLEVDVNLDLIDGFEHYNQFLKWMRSI